MINVSVFNKILSLALRAEGVLLRYLEIISGDLWRLSQYFNLGININITKNFKSDV